MKFRTVALVTLVSLFALTGGVAATPGQGAEAATRTPARPENSLAPSLTSLATSTTPSRSS
ncbi:hypothetical protein [Halospeciosus flavus]|uniref:hypothetical protein n=1 Tax=Halospeciosus flavus TaxID=3032283 RepID=UPI0036D3436B